MSDPNHPSDSIKQAIKQKWNEAFDLAVEFCSDEAIQKGTLRHYHTKKNVKGTCEIYVCEKTNSDRPHV